MEAIQTLGFSDELLTGAFRDTGAEKTDGLFMEGFDKSSKLWVHSNPSSMIPLGVRSLIPSFCPGA